MSCRGQKLAWPFTSWYSEFCCISNELIKWANLFHVDTHLWKLKIPLIIIGWAWSKMGEGFQIMGFSNQVYLTNDLVNWTDWLNDFCMLIVVEYFWFNGQSTLYPWHLNAALVFGQIFRTGFIWQKQKWQNMTPM